MDLPVLYLTISIFKLLDKIPSVERGQGGVICTYDKLISLDDMNKVIPVFYI